MIGKSGKIENAGKKKEVLQRVMKRLNLKEKVGRKQRTE